MCCFIGTRMTSQKALYCAYCYWLTRNNSATGQLKLKILLAYSTQLHSHHTSCFTFSGKIDEKVTTNSYRKKLKHFNSSLSFISQRKSVNAHKKYLLRNFGSKLNHKPVKYFTVFLLSQSHLLLFSQSESSPPGINRLLSHCALFC